MAAWGAQARSAPPVRDMGCGGSSEAAAAQGYALFLAAERGDFATAQRLVYGGANVNYSANQVRLA